MHNAQFQSNEIVLKQQTNPWNCRNDLGKKTLDYVIQYRWIVWNYTKIKNHLVSIILCLHLSNVFQLSIRELNGCSTMIVTNSSPFKATSLSVLTFLNVYLLAVSTVMSDNPTYSGNDITQNSVKMGQEQFEMISRDSNMPK